MSDTYTIRKGECLSSIAKKFGFSRWQTIYKHPDNEAFRKKRPNPNIVCPGDQLTIPERLIREENCTTDKRHKFVLKKQKTLLSIVVQDASGKPLDGKEYKLEIEGRNEPYRGVVESDGLVEVLIEADTVEGMLTVYASGGGYTWHLDIGDLDPVGESSGAIARLQNLAYEIADEASPGDLAGILESFQLEHGLSVTGELDDDTLGRLTVLHDDGQS